MLHRYANDLKTIRKRTAELLGVRFVGSYGVPDYTEMDIFSKKCGPFYVKFGRDIDR